MIISLRIVIWSLSMMHLIERRINKSLLVNRLMVSLLRTVTVLQEHLRCEYLLLFRLKLSFSVIVDFIFVLVVRILSLHLRFLDILIYYVHSLHSIFDRWLFTFRWTHTLPFLTVSNENSAPIDVWDNNGLGGVGVALLYAF